ncbi:hypothetical protein CFOL_v3_22890 [Cephalotus follicularis]|uniref:Uncharacterized protein n=1 Tax=Cephalotus follicularis TaxID=3775 RepID=A0A1Q3CGS6_CEPFO|nr:hypothetical protein CFOL_v3_22890 [Cephalotus follicularis]
MGWTGGWLVCWLCGELLPVSSWINPFDLWVLTVWDYDFGLGISVLFIVFGGLRFLLSVWSLANWGWIGGDVFGSNSEVRWSLVLVVVFCIHRLFGHGLWWYMDCGFNLWF